MHCASDEKATALWQFKWAGLVIAGLLAVAAPAAYADSTFLLQLGTSDSENDATRKWNDLKSRNADVLGNLSPHIAEVSLPPDNKTTYRTQAGPVASLDQADMLCATLKSRGAQCYVVETALFTAEPSAPPPQMSPPPPPVSVTSPPVQPVAQTAEIAPPPAPAAPAALPWSEAATSSGSAVSAYVPGREPKILGSQASSVPLSSAPVAIAPEPAAALAAPPPAKKPGFLSRLFSPSPSAPSPSAKASAPSPSGTANVNVAEAIRVPLSTGTRPPKTAYANVPAVHGLGGTPSGSTHKALWAQLSYFADESEARNFYEDFRNDYPQFSDGIRVRITRPYASNRAGRVSLRIGPFATTRETRAVCSAASGKGLRCTVVRDLGNSAAAYSARIRPVAYGNYENRARAAVADAMEPNYLTYWVQLGSFPSPEEAWDDWQALKDSQKKLLKKITANVTNPPMSSSLRPVFRLRAGPFLSSNSADSLCNTLQAAGHSCIVLSDR